MILSGIYIYPLKSLAGIALTTAVVTGRGLQWDRRLVLTDQNGRVITQREHPRLALLHPEIQESSLTIRYRHDSAASVQMPLAVEGVPSGVAIFDDFTAGIPVSAEADAFFSDFLKIQCQVVYMPNDVQRRVDPAYDRGENIVSYADAYPFLIIGENALSDLNTRLEHPVSMHRFRPNLVFTGGEPYAEDDFYDLQIGAVRFDAVKKCGRCIMTTNDPETGVMGKEPLKTLATYRKVGHRILFGMNLCLNSPSEEGKVIRLGDAVVSKLI